MQKNQQLEQKYFHLREELEQIKSDFTLKKYKILIEAYKLGKKIYGQRYSYFTLSHDFDIPYTTVKRITSLSKANQTTWDLINSGKISSFKVAQVLVQHGPTFQDELCKLIIKENLTTYDIRNLRCRTLAEIKRERLRIATQKGFARKETAYYSLETTLKRLEILTSLKQTHLPHNKLKSLTKQIDKAIELLNKFKLELRGEDA